MRPRMGGNESTPRAVLRAVLIVLSVVAALYVVYLLRRPIGWLVVATFVAVAMSGPVNFLARRMRRGFAIALAYLGLLLVPVALAAVLVPSIVRAGSDLADHVPRYAADIQEFVQENDRLRDFDQDYQITEKIQEQAGKLPGQVGDAAGALADVGSGLVSSIFAAVTILILSIFMVSSGKRWIDRLLELQPPDRAVRLRRGLEHAATAVGNYVAGVLLQATIAGVATYVLLKILGVPFAGALAVLVFFFDLIPLVGATIAAVLVGIVTVFNDFPVDTIVWTVWAIVYQQVENTIIQPRIQSRAVAVHPFAVLVSVLFGSTLFGVVGALLAIPAAATLQIGLREYWQSREEGKGGPATAAGPAEAPT
jgi:predicted PurR-regulated permease PerM